MARELVELGRIFGNGHLGQSKIGRARKGSGRKSTKTLRRKIGELIYDPKVDDLVNVKKNSEAWKAIKRRQRKAAGKPVTMPGTRSKAAKADPLDQAAAMLTLIGAPASEIAAVKKDAAVAKRQRTVAQEKAKERATLKKAARAASKARFPKVSPDKAGKLERLKRGLRNGTIDQMILLAQIEAGEAKKQIDKTADKVIKAKSSTSAEKKAAKQAKAEAKAVVAAAKKTISTRSGVSKTGKMVEAFCKKGQTAARTGCIPKSAIRPGKKKTTAKKKKTTRKAAASKPCKRGQNRKNTNPPCTPKPRKAAPKKKKAVAKKKSTSSIPLIPQKNRRPGRISSDLAKAIRGKKVRLPAEFVMRTTKKDGTTYYSLAKKATKKKLGAYSPNPKSKRKCGPKKKRVNVVVHRGKNRKRGTQNQCVTETWACEQSNRRRRKKRKVSGLGRKYSRKTMGRSWLGAAITSEMAVESMIVGSVAGSMFSSVSSAFLRRFDPQNGDGWGRVVSLGLMAAFTGYVRRDAARNRKYGTFALGATLGAVPNVVELVFERLAESLANSMYRPWEDNNIRYLGPPTNGNTLNGYYMGSVDAGRDNLMSYTTGPQTVIAGPDPRINRLRSLQRLHA